MILKFHVQHDNAAGLQKSKIQAAGESNMAAFAKNSSTTKINFSCWTTWYIWQKFCIEHELDLDFLELSKWKKIYNRIRSQWPTSCLRALFCLNANISRNVEQNLVTFNQNDLQMDLFQIYVTFYTNWPSKMSASAVTKNSKI